MKKIRFSLKKKTIVLITIVAVVILFTNISLFAFTINRITEDQYADQAVDTAETVAISLDPDTLMWLRKAVMEIFYNTENKVGNEEAEDDPVGYETYLSAFSNIENRNIFQRLQDRLIEMRRASRAEYIYLVYPDKEMNALVYLMDSSEGADYCPPGSYDALTGQDKEIFDDPDGGFAPEITNTKLYGWLIAAGVPVYTDEGEIACYVCVDYSMNDVKESENRIVVLVAVALLLLTVVFAAVTLFLIERFLSSPLQKLIKAASQYQSSDQSSMHWGFSELNIHSGDEFELLADAMHQMEEDVNHQIAKLVSTTCELDSTKEQAEAMERLVNKDELTGVRNKRAYEQEVQRLNQGIREGKTQLGIAMIDLNNLKLINDTYGHEKGDVSLKKICDIICTIFDHSPVFRFGGDEFVVILEHHDLEHIEELVQEFESTLGALQSDENLERWEQVSAALGYAIFDSETDNDAEDLFKRADKAMYRRKEQMRVGRQ